MSDRKGNDTKAVQHMSRQQDLAMSGPWKFTTGMSFIDGPLKDVRSKVDVYLTRGDDIPDELLDEVLGIVFVKPDA